jgi:hypothetical protein
VSDEFAALGEIAALLLHDHAHVFKVGLFLDNDPQADRSP